VTDLTMCVLDETGLKLSATAPAGGTCSGKPCWRTGTGALKYVDGQLTRGPISGMTLKAGEAGEAKIVVRAKGEDLGVGALPLTGNVVVRLERSGGPACWQAVFGAARTSDGVRYDAKIP
jgi:hypothetical protein